MGLMISTDVLDLYEKSRVIKPFAQTVIDYVLSLIEAVKSMPALKANDNGMVKDPSNSKVNDFFPMAQESLLCQGPSLSRLHDGARQDFSRRVIGPSQRPLRDNKNNHKKQTSIPLARFELTIPASTQSADPRLRPRGHWDG